MKYGIACTWSILKENFPLGIGAGTREAGGRSVEEGDVEDDDGGRKTSAHQNQPSTRDTWYARTFRN
jgi:hypothetical protein